MPGEHHLEVPPEEPEEQPHEELVIAVGMPDDLLGASPTPDLGQRHPWQGVTEEPPGPPDLGVSAQRRNDGRRVRRHAGAVMMEMRVDDEGHGLTAYPKPRRLRPAF
jgi:hypothetical protein